MKELNDAFLKMLFKADNKQRFISVIKFDGEKFDIHIEAEEEKSK